MMRRISICIALAFAPGVFAAEAGDATLPDVEVIGKKIQPLPALSDSALGNTDLIRLRATTSDTAKLLDGQPGVSLYGAGGVSSLPVIHGMADDRLRIKVDGMDLISACGNHMNPPLSYIDPSQVGSIQVFAGIAPVSVGGDSIGGTIQVDAAAAEFAAAGQETLLKGEAGIFYRSNGNVVGANVSATVAGDKLSMTYSGSTVESGNYKAGGDFKPAGPAFVNDTFSIRNSTKWLPGDEVGSSMYKSTNQSVKLALRNENHLLEMKLGVQDIPYQGFPNQRMDMTANDSKQINLRYKGLYDWGNLEARAYNEHTRHKMNFLEDKAYWYRGNAPGMPMDTEGRNTGALVKADIPLTGRDLLRAGVEYQRYRFSDWWDPSGTGGMAPATFWDINNGERDRLGVFAEWEAQWNTQWLSQLGVRNETVKMDTGIVQGYNVGYTAEANAFNAKNRSRSDHNWDMTALSRYTADSSKNYEFGYAQKTRSPNLYERYTWSTGGMAMNMINMTGDGNGYVGNLDLRPEVARTLSATADWHDAEQQDWGLKVTPYYTYVKDYINARRCTAGDTLMAGAQCAVAGNLTVTNKFVFLKYVNQDAQLYGLDISGHFPLVMNTGFGSFTANGMLNYVRGKTVNGASDNLYNMMPLNTKLSVVQQLNSWTNTAEVQLVDAKTDLSQARNEIRTAGYGLLNLRSSYEWKQFKFDVGVENMLNKLYAMPLGGAYTGQGTTMPPGTPPGAAVPAYGVAVPGMGRSLYAGMTLKF